jgi:putative membrane protein
MRNLSPILLATALLAGPALAQTEPAKNNAAIKSVHTVDDGGAQSGANSFTRAQAREHIAKSGFTKISALTKDKQGVWRGTARKDGHTVHVGLDFKGNVATTE